MSTPGIILVGSLVLIMIVCFVFLFLMYVALECRDSTIETYKHELDKTNNKLMCLSAQLESKGFYISKLWSDSLTIERLNDE